MPRSVKRNDAAPCNLRDAWIYLNACCLCPVQVSFDMLRALEFIYNRAPKPFLDRKNGPPVLGHLIVSYQNLQSMLADDALCTYRLTTALTRPRCDCVWQTLSPCQIKLCSGALSASSAETIGVSLRNESPCCRKK